MHPATEQVFRWFAYEHLPPNLRRVSAQFHDLAEAMAEEFEGSEVTVGLRKLLEAKDCFVRAAVSAQ